MLAFIAKRSLGLLGVLIVVSIITFVLMHQMPGGPFAREKPIPERTIKLIEERYKLDDPLYKQYFDYMYAAFIPRITENTQTDSTNDFLVHIGLPGDYELRWMNFGPSYKARGRTVNDIFRENLPISAQLGTLALLIACAIGIPLGIIAAYRKNTLYDYMGMGVAVLGVSVPVVILAPILRYIFGVQLQWVPPTGWETPSSFEMLPAFLEHAILPSFALGFASSALIARLTRASLLQVLDEDYIRTARAKGLRETVVILRHALKNSMIPVVTVLGPLFAALVTGTFVTEIVFDIPGMGKYFVSSIGNRDYPVIMGTILLYAIFLVLSNFLVDIAYAWLDPRIRFT